jgi:hypothetical protein
MPAAVLFCRVSTQKQAARNESNLPTQQKRCEDWCKSESLPVIRVFVAEGESAWDTDRPVFEECLDFIQKNNGRVSVLCVQDISRFSRNIQQQAVAMAQLTKIGGVWFQLMNRCWMIPLLVFSRPPFLVAFHNFILTAFHQGCGIGFK